ncbi:MAG: glycosyltransferase family 2 protein [Kiritimatiellia bacterium]
MKITLITVCFRSAAVIRTALESVLSQRGADYEYLVIDGGSDDGTVDAIKEYEPKFAGRMRWLSEKDEGMYDAINKGIRMATGGVIGILNADDVLATDDILAQIAAAFESDSALDGTYADIRFIKDDAEAKQASEREEGTLSSSSAPTPPSELGRLRAKPSSRYCSGKWFRPWMFRFGTQTAHPSTFFRRSCFDRWGGYSLNYGMFGDFELLCRFIWKNRARMRYLPICTTVMRAGGASTNGLKSTWAINKTDRRALRDNGFYSNFAFLYSRYLFKVWGLVFRKSPRR